MDYETVKKLLAEKGQLHLLRFYDELNQAEKKNLLNEIANIDWNALEIVQNTSDAPITPIDGLSVEALRERQAHYQEIGLQALKQGKVGAVLLAGGQGTRLGSNGPKGAYNIGITKPLYIFECLINNLLRVCNISGAYVPLYIMTSDKNDTVTRNFFEEHNYFGYPSEYIRFFKQQMAPSTDFDGKLLLEDKGKLVLSPNGNGGWYTSLMQAGLAEEIHACGIEWLNVFAVDNVLQQIADPVFVGATIESGCMSGAKVVKKSRPDERVGALCLRGGMPDVVEYYELSEEMANLRDENGELTYRFGVILNYLFNIKKLDEIARCRIPMHLAKKKISFIDEEGNKVVPTEENGYKFEMLILDMIRLMGSCLPCEVVREKEFAPIKNLTGIDSVESARALLTQNGVKL